MADKSAPFVIYNLRQTYHEQGEYNVKVVLNPKRFKNCHGSSIRLVDASNQPMKFELNPWGRKLNVNFTIDHSTAEGISGAYLNLIDSRGRTVTGSFMFWVVQ